MTAGTDFSRMLDAGMFDLDDDPPPEDDEADLDDDEEPGNRET